MKLIFCTNTEDCFHQNIHKTVYKLTMLVVLAYTTSDRMDEGALARLLPCTLWFMIMISITSGVLTPLPPPPSLAIIFYRTPHNPSNRLQAFLRMCNDT